MTLFDNIRLLAQQQRAIQKLEENVVLWQHNSLLAARNQRDLLVFFLNALNEENEPDWLKDELVGMLLKIRNDVAVLEEHIL